MKQPYKVRKKGGWFERSWFIGHGEYIGLRYRVYGVWYKSTEGVGILDIPPEVAKEVISEYNKQ